MTRRHVAILMAMALVLSLQFIVPMLQFPSPGANRWGWQMYSRENPRPDIVAHLSDGTTSQIQFSDHVYSVRAEMRLTDPVLRQLCERVPDAISFELLTPSTGELESMFPCDP
jgi:hypothetical protein